MWSRKLRGDAVVAEQAHNLLVVGANPTPATKVIEFQFANLEDYEYQ